ncbi:arylsulfatase [Caulobacter sp. 17J65-9]|uniref:arylsulfatase n=1 Tax=Caulobacter sp. 17J65-9 TaxID=2709382 RepID=UPI0013C9CBA3|nr:arylsulfatase [Caulobacter sp. 17J65-9]NEX94457.1 arylsulfatase [Caulobacter sp. 17J65-9]
MPVPFKGVVKVDVRDSKPDWAPYLAPKAPEGAPNVLVILYDDTGLAAWSPFGGGIDMPTAQKLADNGLIYSQWHTTALCSPTRSCFLTGRNHHQNGFACISEAATGFPGSHGHIPMECAYLAQVMREKGWNTYWLGKDHNLAIDETSMGSSKRNWPCMRGFDRFYGFLGGETDQYFPALVEDNHYVEQPYGPEDGYHLSRDLADMGIEFIRDSKAAAPDKPWYMFFCPGANHAPHQVPKEWADKYKGKFDAGYEAYREWALPRMIAKGILPKDTKLTPLNPMPEDAANELDFVRPWDSLNDQEKKLFCRMAEVYAGFSEYTDAQIGRLIAYLEDSGQLDNTLVFYCADNGASGEGSPNGSVNENKFFNGFPDSLDENLKYLDKLGSPDTYNHYPTGWAAAFSTPFRMFKRYTYQGGIADPMIISWPKGIKAKGQVRSQYHHVTDVVPTILDCCGIEFPDMVQGYPQVPQPGVSMRYSFDDAKAPTQKVSQYYCMLGTRAIWSQGWKAVAVHSPTSGKGHFDKDKWQLFHSEVDPAEVTDLADKHPEKLKELVEMWFREAGKYDVLPLDDRLPVEILSDPRPRDTSPRDVYFYYPGTSEIPTEASVILGGRSYKILADVKIDGPECQGVIFAHGSRFGGHTLFIKDRRLHYVYNFLGIEPEQKFSSDVLAPGDHVLGMEFVHEKVGEHGEGLGRAKLYVDDKVVAEGPMRAQTGHFSLCGEGLCVGRDSSDAVSREYSKGFPFTGGVVRKVAVYVGKEAYVDLELKARAMMARE